MKQLIEENLILRTDSYKISHHLQYPEDTEIVFSFFESRGGKWDNTLFFGLQYILERYLAGVVVTQEDIDEAALIFARHFDNPNLFNRAGWQRIVDVHGGRLPIIIRAIPEGTEVPTHNVLITIENTDPQLPWLTNYVETILSQVWYPTTVATQSREMKRTILHYLKQTGDPSLIFFKLHDFGFRGSTSVESAGLGGLAHLVNFLGTDTMEALRFGRLYYGEQMAGFSIPAAEHSTITSWGATHEADAYRNMLQKFPTGLVAVVSDSYDIYNACAEVWGNKLKPEVLHRDGVLVVRPDSGDPRKVVVEILNILGKKFGYTRNQYGYLLLNPKIRIIQGDGIDYESLGEILAAMEEAGWSADNVAFGSGGGLLQKVNRDTLKFAFKCSAIRRNGVWYDVMKDPITDPGKRSKAGRLVLTFNNGMYRTMREEEAEAQGLTNLLEVVFENGEMVRKYTLAEIRERAALT